MVVDSEVLLSEALLDIEHASDEKSLDSLRVQYLGKKGSFTELLKTLGKLPAGQRPRPGSKSISPRKISSKPLSSNAKP